MFATADRRAFAKALSLYSISYKYIKLIIGIYEKNFDAVKARN